MVGASVYAFVLPLHSSNDFTFTRLLSDRCTDEQSGCGGVGAAKHAVLHTLGGSAVSNFSSAFPVTECETLVASSYTLKSPGVIVCTSRTKRCKID